MTPSITEIAARVLRLAEGATAGEWLAENEDTDAGQMSVVRRKDYFYAIAITDPTPFPDEQAMRAGDAAFIADARTSAPALAQCLIDIAKILDSDVSVIDGIRAIRLLLWNERLLGLDAPPTGLGEAP